MKYRLPLRNRLLLIIISTVAVIYSLGIGYISIRYKEKAKEDALKLIRSVANEKAAMIKASMDHDFAISRSMAQSMLAIESSSFKNKADIQFDILSSILKSNPNYIASFLQWELKDIDPKYQKSHGRRRYLSYRQYPVLKDQVLPGQFYDSPIDTIKGIVDIDSYDPENPYYLVRDNHQEFIINPYFYSYHDVKEMPADYPTQPDAILETTIIVPIIQGGKFKALTGVDIPLNHFMDLIQDISPFDESFAFVVANNGAFVAHPSPVLLAQSISECGLVGDMAHKHFDDIRIGKSFSFTTDIESEGTMLFTMSPIQMGNTKQPWSLGIGIPERVIIAEAQKDFFISISTGIIGLVLLIILIAWFARNISRPIEATTLLLNDLSKGQINTDIQLKVNTKDEVEDMAKSANKLLKGFIRTTRFAHEVGEGDLNTHYELLSKEDILGQSLLDMRNKLKQSKTEIELKNRELEKLSMVAQQTDNAVIIMDGMGRLEWINKAFERLYGYNLEEIKENFGNSLDDLSNHAEIRSLIDQCCSKRKTIAYNSVLKSKDGKVKYAQTTLTPVLDETGYVMKMIAIDSDITELQKAKLEIEHQKNELEQLNATKDKFFSILAHDLKNPFTTVHSLSHLINDNYQSIDELDRRDIIHRICDSSQHIYNLLDNLLTWSRSQRGLIKVNPVSFCLNEVISTNLNLQLAEIQNKNLVINNKISEKQMVFADRDMIATVIRNLINNAVKFTPEKGTIQIDVSKPNDKLRLDIIDSGIGIAGSDLKKLFRIDIKTQSIGQSKEKGTGLGLILCKEFIERNKGQIEVTSQLGHGSTFSIILPIKQN